MIPTFLFFANVAGAVPTVVTYPLGNPTAAAQAPIQVLQVLNVTVAPAMWQDMSGYFPFHKPLELKEAGAN